MGEDSEKLLSAAEKKLAAMHVSEAIELFNRAERAGCDPDACAAGRWKSEMLLGNFEQAWRESDAIAQRGKPDPHRFWDGESLDGQRVLVRCLHGLGDTIQFIRYAPLLRMGTRSLFIEAQPKLQPLLTFSDLADSVFTWGMLEPKWDKQIEIMELPRIFRTTLQTIPDIVPYLCAPYDVSTPRRTDFHQKRVGIVWTAGAFDPARSIPPGMLTPLFNVPNVAFFNLQAGTENSDFEPLPTKVRGLTHDDQSIFSTAKIVQELDLVITVDTMMAHLAGSLAVPVWTLLPYRCDWRWMLKRSRSPWYPTMRLFRQASPGDWLPVIAHLRNELCKLANTFVETDC